MSHEIDSDRERAAAFVEAYGRSWERWNFGGFVDLFSDDVIYVAHATEKTVVGRAGLAEYIREEAADQGRASVRMGKPVIDGDHVAAEFWVVYKKWCQAKGRRPSSTESTDPSRSFAASGPATSFTLSPFDSAARFGALYRAVTRRFGPRSPGVQNDRVVSEVERPSDPCLACELDLSAPENPVSSPAPG